MSGGSDLIEAAPPESAADGLPLRILVITQHYWPESLRINSFVEELIACGAEVAVLTGQPNYPAGKTFAGYGWYKTGRQRHSGRYDIYRVPLVPRGRSGALGLALNYLSFMTTGSIVGPALLRGRRFDVLFVYGTSPILQAFVGLPLRRLKKAKLVLWVQDLWPHALAATGYVKSPRILAAVEKVVAWLYRRADLILAQSEPFVEAIRPLAGRTPVRYFPNPGDPAAKNAAATAIRLPEAFNVIFAGNLGRAQALHIVVEAATLLRDQADIRITLFGSGSMQEWIAGEIERRGLTNLVLAGRVSPETMPGIYAQASAALLTLVDDDMVAKTVPSKLQSYLGAGVPIIAATRGEPARVVGASGAGITCAPEEAALAGSIIAMRDRSKAELSAMRESGRAYYDAHFEPRRLARNLIGQLEALVRK